MAPTAIDNVLEVVASTTVPNSLKTKIASQDAIQVSEVLPTL